MAVTIGLGPSAGTSGAGKGGVPAGLEAFMAQAGATAAEEAQDGSSSDLAANPFMSQLAAALQALQSGSAEDLQAAALALAGQEGQILQNQIVQAGSQDASGQDLPLDPSFSSAVMATFAAVQEMIRQHGVSDAGSGENLADSEQELAADNQDTISDPSQLVAALSLVPGQVIANSVSAAGDAGNGSASTNVAAVLAAGAAANSAEQALMQQNAALAQTESGAVAAGQSAVNPGVQTAINRLQAELGQSKSSEQSDSGKSAQTGLVQKNIATVAGKNLPSNAITDADKLAQRLALDSASDLESSTHALEQAAGGAGMALHSENVALMQQGLDIGIGADASAKSGAARTDAANASQLQGTTASIEARVEAARASLASGPLNVEVLRLTRQGGGRAVLEVTPPNQGPIRLDLQLDGSGRASLVVEGLSEALRTRLEDTAHFLRQDMAQMGLALNLEMRERSDAQAQQAAFGQGGFQSQREEERQALENSLTSSKGSDSVGKASIATTADKEGGVYLYA